MYIQVPKTSEQYVELVYVHLYYYTGVPYNYIIEKFLTKMIYFCNIVLNKT